MNTIPVELEEAGYIDGCTRNNSVCKDYFPSFETGYLHNHYSECGNDLQ